MSGAVTSSTFPLVVVSNRLPVSFSVNESGAKVPTLSPGGLVAAVAPSLRGKNSAWVGWDGTDSGETDEFVAEDITLFPVSLSASLVERHYEGFSNGTLWPLFHDVGVEPEFDPSWWEAYREVNATCAARAAEVTNPGGIVWVHDYQMMLVPALLRELRPDVTIGYFHHIPFCHSKTFAALPEHAQLLRGIAGADIVGFQRDQDRDNFTDSISTAQLGDVRAETYPISLDFEAVSSAANDSAVRTRAAALREEWGNPTTVFLGVDRIDYTKGIPERLEAFEGLLQSGRVSAEDCVMVQAGSPSRENVPSYQALRSRIEDIVARINSAFQSSGGRPAIIYTAQNLERAEMLALFVAADVMVVSSLRDGMNLVAKEFVACRNDDSGVLILSPFTGAADRMVDALIADPTQQSELEAAMVLAMGMTPEEQNKRMAALREEVRIHDVAWWADQIIGDLASLRSHP
ncbi:MAG: trehalose-6-phosphate synthase [Actinobacteria bacterium]|nr:trehalose-6-phosphate synthase [Actinomycetota bacterium]